MMFRAIDVWKRLDDSRLVRYRCFQVLPDGGYCVQSADFYMLPYSPEQVAAHERQFIELLTEEAPNSRSRTFSTIEEAIEKHEEEFTSF